MMIGPETFYDVKLRGKSAEEIKKVIARLKRKINELKRKIEHPNYAITMYPTEDTVIACYRLYIERAKGALEQMGVSYEPDASEKRDIEFNYNISSISRLIFEIRCFSIGWCTVTVEVGDTVRVITENTMPASLESCVNNNYEIERKDFFKHLSELHMGEWRRKYDTKRFGIYVLDGYSWKLKIEYNNGVKPFVREGSNSSPYNFEKMTDALGVDIYDYLN